MPLFADGLKKIRNALLAVEAGNPSPFVRIGAFTTAQLKLINDLRIEDELEPIDGVIIFNGKHLHASRCVHDGYSIEEVLEQIRSAFCENAEFSHNRSTVMFNPVARIGKDGHQIHDEAVFECHERHPSPILRSVIPRGDGRYRPKR